MKSFADFMMNIPTEYVPRIENAISDACRTLGDPNATHDQYEKISRQLTTLQHKVGRDSLNALKREIEARLKAQWTAAGHSGLMIERQLAPRVNDLLNRAESARQIVEPSFWAPLKAMPASTLMIFGGLAVGARIFFPGREFIQHAPLLPRPKERR